jgi:hypothetical protein
MTVTIIKPTNYLLQLNNRKLLEIQGNQNKTVADIISDTAEGADNNTVYKYHLYNNMFLFILKQSCF